MGFLEKFEKFILVSFLIGFKYKCSSFAIPRILNAVLVMFIVRVASLIKNNSVK